MPAALLASDPSAGVEPAAAVVTAPASDPAAAAATPPSGGRLGAPPPPPTRALTICATDSASFACARRGAQYFDDGWPSRGVFSNASLASFAALAVCFASFAPSAGRTRLIGACSFARSSPYVHANLSK